MFTRSQFFFHWPPGVLQGNFNSGKMQFLLTTSLFTVKTLSAKLSKAIHFTGILAILPCL